jgi:hypothetical protein
VFENRAMSRILGRRGKEISGTYRIFHREDLYNSYCSHIIFRAVKSGRTKWVRNAVCMGKIIYKIFEDHRRRSDSENVGVDGSIIFK